MKAHKLDDGIFWVGAHDWDRKLFDDLIPLPDGTSYNSYLIVGSQKTALIDTVDPSMQEVLISRLNDLGLKKIDYIVANHAEQDHSGALPKVLEKFPMAKILCTNGCKSMLMDLLPLNETQFQTVNDNENISLGDKTLEFIHFPWVHWPETMLTYLPEQKILFPCDLFGSHMASSHLFVRDEAQVLMAAKRYFAEIMMPYRHMIIKKYDRISQMELKWIAPSHGPIYDTPIMIVDAYREWISSKPKNLAIVGYVSMHGSTKIMAEHMVDALSARGIPTEQFNLSDVDLGKLSMSPVDAATLILGSPVTLSGTHPKVSYITSLANILNPKLKFVGLFGSQGWGGKLEEQIKSGLSNLEVEYLNPVLTKGVPREKDLRALDQLADDIRARHADLEI